MNFFSATWRFSPLWPGRNLKLSYQRVSYGINTFAGLRIFGDGGPAVQTQLYGPVGVAVDGSGNLYIADRDNDRIRKVDSRGTITTVAGGGRGNGLGNDGPATQAQFAFPAEVAVDGSDNLYIADRDTHRIRKVDPTGRITTIVGTGSMAAMGTEGRQSRRSSPFPTAWRWTARATSTSPIPATTAFARSIPRGRLRRLRG